MNLFTLLAEQAKQNPQKFALIDGKCGSEREITFSQFHDQAVLKSHELREIGIKKGSKVLVMIPMCTELYVTLSALWHIGATALFLDPSAGRSHIKACCNKVPPDALIGIPKARLLSLLYSPLRRIKLKHYWRLKSPERALKDESMPVELENDHPAILTFTSGSTGKPKAAIRTHGLLHAQHKALLSVLETQADEVDMATMPVLTLINLASGITTLIPDADLSKPGFIKPKPVLRQIEHYKPTRTIASPSFLYKLHNEASKDAASLSCFKKIFSGGAPVFPNTVEQMTRSFKNATITTAYGSTEAEPISHVEWSDYSSNDRKRTREGGGLLVGYVSDETKLLVIKEQWGKPIYPSNVDDLEKLSLKSSEAGEIIVAGEHVIPGYVDGEGDDENKIKVGDTVWHRTGDAGYLDDHGRLWLLGRCSAKFKYQERTVYPFAVEAAAVERLGCSIAACIEHKGEPMLILPEGSKAPDYFRVGDITINKIKNMGIPLDKRHNAKVNYSKLKAKLVQG